MVWSPTRYLWQFEVNGPIKEVWKLIADTHRIRYTLGLTAGTAELSLTKRKKAKQPSLASQLLMGTPSQAAADWIKEAQCKLHFNWEGGFFRRLDLSMELEEISGTTTIRVGMDVTPSNILGRLVTPLLFGKRVRKRMTETFRNIERFIENNGDAVALASFSPLSEEQLKLLDERGKELVAEGFRASWVKPLVQIISLDSDDHLRQIAPFAYAEKWGIPRKRIVELFFAATTKNLLRPLWLLRCPKCLKNRISKESLEGLHSKGRCPSCDIYFHNNLARNVELAFTPHADIRELQSKGDSERGPASNRQAYLKQTLEPHEIRVLETIIPPGTFRVRSDCTKPEQWVTTEFTTENRGELSVEVGKEALTVHFSGKEERFGIRLGNRTDQPQTVWIEDLGWKSEALTAIRATTYQQFRSLFPKEVMSPAEVLGTDQITLLKVEIMQAGTVFRRKGDESSYLLLKEFQAFLEQIIDHHDGAIVRTSAEGVLAAFLEPVKGTTAALSINQDLETFNATLSETERLGVRVAVHHGECVAINLNNHLDFFGDSVNVASYLPAECGGRDIVLSEEVAGDKKVSELLKSETLESSEVEASLPEFEEPLKALRVRGHLTE